MFHRRLMLASCTCLIGASMTFADLHEWSGPAGASAASSATGSARYAGAQHEVRPTFPLTIHEPELAVTARIALNAAAVYELREVPGLPGSAGLFLSAAISVGAWHVLRNAKHLHLAHLPDWYHAGGPAQVGHAVPFDLDFGALLPSDFDAAINEPIRALRRFESHPVWRLLSQCALILAAPRGPPSCF